MITSDSKVLITGASGLLGHGLVSAFMTNKQYNGIRLYTPTHKELDCLSKDSVREYIKKVRPDFVFHLASLVYGIQGNLDNQLKSLSKNTLMYDNLFSVLSELPVKKVFFAGTVASYAFPYKELPLKEEDFLSGDPHWGEYGYAMAKRHALAYLTVLQKNYSIPFVYGLFTNLYGPYDRFNVKNGHVIPSLILKAQDAQKVGSCFKVWGKRNTTRDFLHSFDAGAAAIHTMNNLDGVVNIASGVETTMEEVVGAIVSHYDQISHIEWQTDKPVGIPRRVIDVTRLKASGFSPQYDLRTGIADTISWLSQNFGNIRS